jgi:hypothetical protein
MTTGRQTLQLLHQHSDVQNTESNRATWIKGISSPSSSRPQNRKKQHSQCQWSWQKPTPIRSTADPLGPLSRNFTRHKLGKSGKWDTGIVGPVLCKNGGVKQYTCEMFRFTFYLNITPWNISPSTCRKSHKLHHAASITASKYKQKYLLV